MPNGSWLTPPATPVIHTVCRRLLIPAQYLPAVRGALELLTEAWNWEQFGIETPDEAAQLMRDMMDAWEGDCMPVASVIWSASMTIPIGYLNCNGSKLNRVDYP